MKKYEIEHIGICVEKPIEMANWYHETLGFNIKFLAEDEEKAVAFLTDGGDKVMLEIGKIPDILPLTKRLSHHLQLHIALKSIDPDKDADYLVSKGAIFIEKTILGSGIIYAPSLSNSCSIDFAMNSMPFFLIIYFVNHILS